MLTYLSAYGAGLLTLINPCVLPLLPIIISAAFQGSRHGPLMLALGLTLSFTVIGVGVSAFGHLLGIDEFVINRVAAIMMVAFGIVLLVPRLQDLLSRAASPLANNANAGIDAVQGAGAKGQFAVGVLLGAVWSPCIGPTLGGALGLAASGEGLAHATLNMVQFGLGVSSVLLMLSYGSRGAVAQRRGVLMSAMPYAKPIMGVALLCVGVALLLGLNHMLDAWLLDTLPSWLVDLSVSL